MMELGKTGLLGLFIASFLAATVLPFSADALYVAALAALDNHLATLVVATLGNWLGGATTFFIGWLGRWQWMERWFKVKPETLEKQKRRVDRYGVWLALLSWVPIVGDVITLALGFYKTPPVTTVFLIGVGKFARFALWTMLLI